MKIIVAERGTKQKTINVKKIHIHDLWHIAMEMKNPVAQKMVLDVWHLSHDMYGALCHIADGADLKKPIHTK